MRSRSVPCMGLLILATCVSGCITTEDWSEHLRHRVISRSIPAEGVELVYLKIYRGTIRIVQAEQESVTLEGEIRMSGASIAAVQRDLDAFRIDSDVLDHDVLRVQLRRPGRRYEADLTITVPTRMALDVDLRYGTLVADLHAPQQTTIHVNAGEVVINIPRATVAHLDARATIGEVSLHGFDAFNGDAPRKKLIGARYHGELGFGNAQESIDIDLKVTAGSIDIRATD